MSDPTDIVERLREALADVQNFRGDLESDDFNDACAGLRFQASQAAPELLARIDAQAAEITRLRADLATSMETLAKAQALQAEMLKERAALAQPARHVERERSERLRQALLKCKTCALPTEVRELVNSALRA